MKTPAPTSPRRLASLRVVLSTGTPSGGQATVASGGASAGVSLGQGPRPGVSKRPSPRSRRQAWGAVLALSLLAACKSSTVTTRIGGANGPAELKKLQLVRFGWVRDLRRDPRTPWKIPQIRQVNPHRGGPCFPWCSRVRMRPISLASWMPSRARGSPGECQTRVSPFRWPVGRGDASPDHRCSPVADRG